MFFLAALAAFVLALRAFIDTRRVRARLTGLTQQVSGLDRRLAQLGEEVGLRRSAGARPAAAL